MLHTIDSGAHGNQAIEVAGVPLEKAQNAVVLLHGRGASAQSILGLAGVLEYPDTTYLAPQAAGSTWYPYRFIAPIEQNEPYLSSALNVVDGLVQDLEEKGISRDRIVVGGFSQGACLAGEYAARNPARYGALLVFSGGLIGPPGGLPAYTGSLEETPVFLGCDAEDFHIPIERIHETEEVLTRLGARVTKRIYSGMGHTISTDEIREARRLLDGVFVG